MKDRPMIMFSQLQQNADGSYTANILVCESPLDESYFELVSMDPRKVTPERAPDGKTISLTATFKNDSGAYNFFDVYLDFMRDVDRACEDWGVTYHGAAYGREPRGPEQFRALYPHLAELVWDESPPEPAPDGALSHRDWLPLSLWLLEIKCWFRWLRKYASRS